MKSRISWAVPLIAAGLLIGCAKDRVNEDFGRSVRLMISEQSANPVLRPNQSPGGLDGEKAEAALETYRRHGADAAEVGAPIEINIGGGL